MHSNRSTSVYDNFSGSSPVALRVFDEQDGGVNSGATYYYGNIIINRQYGIWIASSVTEGEVFSGNIYVFNNTIIDSYLYNFFVNNPQNFTGDIYIYNNASILIDRPSATHALDYNDFLPSSGWTVDNNAFWTAGDFPAVDSDWQTNYVTADPSLPGSGWTAQTGADYYFGIDFSDI